MSQIWLQKSHDQEFFQQNWLYRLNKFILENIGNLWFDKNLDFENFSIFFFASLYFGIFEPVYLLNSLYPFWVQNWFSAAGI